MSLLSVIQELCTDVCGTKSSDAMAAFVPLLQTLVWPVFLSVIIVVYRRQFKKLIKAIQKRIKEGSPFQVGPFKIGEALKALEYAAPSNEQQPGAEDWEQERNSVYRDNYGIFLVHVIRPSQKQGQRYDIFIYLLKHKTADLSDVDYAEFFLGHMWGNKVFREEMKEGMIGMSTSAYGPFLCMCRVHMKGGSVVKLERYIDLEMGDMLGEARK